MPKILVSITRLTTIGLLSLIPIVLTAGSSDPAETPNAAESEIAKFASAWSNITAFTCTIDAHEVSGNRVQDRTYNMFFHKPHDTRLEITKGDSRGSIAVWRGGTRVIGHRGGVLSFAKLNVDIHSPLVVTIRGTTIADPNFGAILDHIRGLDRSSAAVASDNGLTRIDIAVADPSTDKNVTRERLTLGRDSLPIEYEQWQMDSEVERVMYLNVKLNPPISDATFKV
jgi:hypothetical protein